MLKSLPIIFAACFLCSCSINSVGIPGTVKTQYYENNTCRIKDISAWGFHLRTEPSFSFTIGAVEFRYLTVKPESSPPEKISVLEAMSFKNSKSWQEAEAFDSGDPFVTHLGITGLSLGSDHFLLGAQRASRLLVPQEFKGLLIYNYDEKITKTTAYIQKEK